jgi:hypothetical protein
MKTKLVFFLALLAGFVLFSSLSFSQEKSKGHNTAPVPGAKLTIEFKGKTAYCRTNGKGEFAIYLPDTSKTFIEAKEYKAILTVDLPNNFKESADNKTLNYMLKQSDAPYYEFTLLYDKSKNQLLIKPNTNIQQRESKIKLQKGLIKARWNRENGDASKVGDKYQGEVAHF